MLFLFNTIIWNACGGKGVGVDMDMEVVVVTSLLTWNRHLPNQCIYKNTNINMLHITSEYNGKRLKSLAT